MKVFGVPEYDPKPNRSKYNSYPAFDSTSVSHTFPFDFFLNQNEFHWEVFRESAFHLNEVENSFQFSGGGELAAVQSCEMIWLKVSWRSILRWAVGFCVIKSSASATMSQGMNHIQLILAGVAVLCRSQNRTTPLNCEIQLECFSIKHSNSKRLVGQISRYSHWKTQWDMKLVPFEYLALPCDVYFPL